MFYNDHAPPHFHAQYGEFEPTIDIDTLGGHSGRASAPGIGVDTGMGDDTQRGVARQLGTMPRERLPGKDRAVNLVERSGMYWDVVEVKPEPEYCLLVRFKDGLTGRIQLLEKDLTGALAPLRDSRLFERVFIDNGAVAWPGEIDLASDAMYEDIVSSLDPAEKHIG